MDDLEFMQQALTCARAVEGRTSPRPPVGAVVVRDGVVIGRGATSPPYGPHAEIHALREAGTAAGADLYTTLEPCCITIHTPPCTEAIIAAGIQRVIIGTLDPHPRISGRGVEQLRAAGIEVVTSVAEQEASALLRPFATFITLERPYVTAKWAMTLDGKLATHTGDAFWISGPAARLWVHDLRDRVDAILIGSGTACADNPSLTVRLTDAQRTHRRTPRQGPLRVVIATQGRLDTDLHLFEEQLVAQTCVIVGETCSLQQRERLLRQGIEVVAAAVNETGQVDLAAALKALVQKGIMHVLLEGGSHLLGSAFDSNLIDHIAAFIAPKLAGGAGAPSPVGGAGLAVMQQARCLQNVAIRTIEGDLLVEGDIITPSADLLPAGK